MTDISEEIQVTLRIFSFMTLNIYLKRKEKVKISFHVYLSKRKINPKKSQSQHHSDLLTVCVIMYYEFRSNIIAFLKQLKIFLKILIDAISEMWTGMTDIAVFRKKLQKFLQGVLYSLCSMSY